MEERNSLALDNKLSAHKRISRSPLYFKGTVPLKRNLEGNEVLENFSEIYFKKICSYFTIQI